MSELKHCPFCGNDEISIEQIHINIPALRVDDPVGEDMAFCHCCGANVIATFWNERKDGDHVL